MNKKQNTLDISLFLFSSILIVVLFVSYYFVHSNLENERDAVKKEAELQSLSFQLQEASNYLTAEVRKFTVTLNPVHLRNYWKEVNVTKTREKVINRLKDLNTPQNEFELLNKAKNNSDDLMNIEIHAMKLILEVYEVPPSEMEPAIRDYQLTEANHKLNYNGKVNLAREIVYNSTYENAKKQILNPINQFDKIMNNRITRETEYAINQSEKSHIFNLITLLTVATYLIYIAWFVFHKISVPLKKYVQHLQNDEEICTEELTKSNAYFWIQEFVKAKINSQKK